MSKYYHFFTNRIKLSTPTIRFEGIAATYDDTMFLDRIQILDSANNIVSPGFLNFDFSTPAQGDGYYQYFGGVTNSPYLWTFFGGAGVATNGSAFNVPGTPDGNAVGFIQNSPSGFEQQVQMKPGKYRIRYITSQRYNQAQVVLLKVNGVEVDRYQAPGGQGFVEWTSKEFEIK